MPIVFVEVFLLLLMVVGGVGLTVLVKVVLDTFFRTKPDELIQTADEIRKTAEQQRREAEARVRQAEQEARRMEGLAGPKRW